MAEIVELLTCAMCLERYRHPRMLPCQHSFCMEPCLDGLVRIGEKQVPCPLCRAEYDIPSQGVQAFPINKTLQSLLEAHPEKYVAEFTKTEVKNENEGCSKKNIGGDEDHYGNAKLPGLCENCGYVTMVHHSGVAPSVSPGSDHKSSTVCKAGPSLSSITSGFSECARRRNLYLEKGPIQFTLGNENGLFGRIGGIAVTPDNSIVVSDILDNCIKVFDSNGILSKTFGCFGCGEVEFNCPKGITVNHDGLIIVADTNNHRIQIVKPSGEFIRLFGSYGTEDGKFLQPCLVTTDKDGFIYVYDAIKSLVQVFRPEGNFLRKFNDPKNVLKLMNSFTVTKANQFIITTSGKFELMILDARGNMLNTIPLRLMPWTAVAVDDVGHIILGGGDEGYILNADYTTLKSFTFNFQVEFVAVMTNGTIVWGGIDKLCVM